MIQKNLRVIVLIMSSGLCASGVFSLSHATNVTPNQRIVPTPIQFSARGATANTQNPNAKQQPNPKRPAQAPPGPVPPEIQSGIKALVNAKASLEKAGDKWGGHRVKAIKLIDQALKACGQTQTHSTGEMQSGPTDDAASMQAGTTELTNAQKDFNNSTDTWGGRKDKALPLINQALQELQAATDAQKKRK